jgi:uncharacterized protein YndB with AHSA1/START domain
VPELVLQVDTEASPEQAWAALVDWDRQGEWMLLTDVRAGAQGGQGVGGELAAVTGVKLPGLKRLGVLDTMLITRWDEPRRVDVRHTGRVVRGTGTFELRPRTGGGSTFVWTEGLDLPLGVLGRLGWPLVKPLFAAGVQLSLRRFATYAAAYPH